MSFKYLWWTTWLRGFVPATQQMVVSTSPLQVKYSFSLSYIVRTKRYLLPVSEFWKTSPPWYRWVQRALASQNHSSIGKWSRLSRRLLRFTPRLREMGSGSAGRKSITWSLFSVCTIFQSLVLRDWVPPENPPSNVANRDQTHPYSLSEVMPKCELCHVFRPKAPGDRGVPLTVSLYPGGLHVTAVGTCLVLPSSPELNIGPNVPFLSPPLILK